MKKIFILLLSSVLAISVVFLQPVNEANAIVSKLMGLSAKKIGKEVAKDIAIETATNYAVNAAFEIAQAQMDKYNQEQAYKIVCLSSLTGEVCDKPVAIKENLTEADKIAIGRQAEIELENLVSPTGTGFTRWQKFLDWFGPVWITGAIMTVITYAIDGDVRDLFNEIGYKALVALGFIKPVTEVQPMPIENVVPPERTIQNGAQDTTLFAKYIASSSSAPNHSLSLTLLDQPSVNGLIQVQYDANKTDLKIHNLSVNDNYYAFIDTAADTYTHSLLAYSSTSTDTLTVHINGVSKLVTSPGYSNGNAVYYFNSATTGINTHLKKMKSVMTRLPYKIGDFWYTDSLVLTTDGNLLKMQLKTTNYNTAKVNTVLSGSRWDTTPSSGTQLTFFRDISPNKKILVPPYIESNSEMQPSRYEKDDEIALIPPVAIPMTQTSTGKKVTLAPNPTPGGEPIATNEDGEIVQDEDVTMGDPVVTENPQGQPQVTPEPTASNPSPEPMPLIPTPPIQPPTTGEPPPPPEDGGGGKPNIPLSLLIGLFKLLFAIIFFLIRMFTFIVTIQMIPPVPIPNAAFQWFTTAQFMGIKPYPLIINTATFFLGFSIYKSIRRVFP